LRQYDSEFRAAVAAWMPNGPDWRWTKAQGIQESGLRADARSSAGAIGIMQVMPGTWAEIERALGWRNVNPRSAHHNVFGGTYFQARMDRIWSGRGRSTVEAHLLGLASYNAGPRSVIRAQSVCADALLWSVITPCLGQVTGGANAGQTIGYVRNIPRWRAALVWPCRWQRARGGCGPNLSEAP
jgi:membrane-bound lytic murein transglycosylase F